MRELALSRYRVPYQYLPINLQCGIMTARHIIPQARTTLSCELRRVTNLCTTPNPCNSVQFWSAEGKYIVV